ncbi:MAG: glycoside hydrolase family 2 TIM barrel-domain containing protein [Clostridiales bacterium]|nr:glycoside hydrolase family 2 protein [Roseburia sp.]MDD7638345.1 glycoside hydrolase family 2 TIM barrel-domain containing protein [Clostridiales bacterium]MDY4111340.1 glycoside hydrolase family 2 TIM barrel-domain containing protein [Roseburia sp.]
MRTIQTINTNWYFSKDAKEVPAALPTSWEQITLPHTWNGKDGQDGGNDYYRGTCFYAKSISSDSFPNQDIHYLQFEGVNSSAEVYWNGKKLITHHGGYSAFRVRLDEILDDNLLVVAADNSPNDFVYPQNADFTFYGGIYRDVKIVSVPAAHFDMDYYGAPGIMVTPVVNGANAEVSIESFLTSAENCEVQYEISDNGEKLLETTVSAADTKASLTLENVHLWNGRKDPHLYTLVANLIQDGAVIDMVQTRFGCRSFSIDPERGFILNGEAYPLRGVSRHQDRPDIGNALTIEHHKEDMNLICELGATTIRLAHYQHAQEFYDLCDERGMVIWAEIPYISSHLPKGLENTMSQMTELICQNYNHPSIVVWGLSNEITMGGAADPSLLDNHRQLNDLVHKLDATRPTTMAALTMCSMDEDIVHISDVLSYNHYFGWYGGTTDMNGPWFDKFHAKYPNTPIGISEYGCEALNWHTSAPEQGDYTEEYQAYYHEELIKQIAERPYLWATHVWNMFDFAADARAEGGENGMNHKGLVTFDRKYKKDSFYAYKAWLSDEPFVHICGKRYIDRVEDVTKVTVYTNQPEVELFANGESLGKQTKDKYPFFYFEVPNVGETTLTAKTGDCSDESHIRKVDTFNEDYRLKMEGAVINWFEITTPPGYYSINDTLGDVMSTFRGKLAVLKLFKALMGGKKDKDGKKKDSGTVAGFKINKDMMEMAKAFTIKRILMMLGDSCTKEQILGINASLNKIKKK